MRGSRFVRGLLAPLERGAAGGMDGCMFLLLCDGTVVPVVSSVMFRYLTRSAIYGGSHLGAEGSYTHVLTTSEPLPTESMGVWHVVVHQPAMPQCYSIAQQHHWMVQSGGCCFLLDMPCTPSV
jgi:hypothetical protein